MEYLRSRGGEKIATVIRSRQIGVGLWSHRVPYGQPLGTNTFAVFREALLAPEICPRSLARTVEESVAQDKRPSSSIQNKQIGLSEDLQSALHAFLHTLNGPQLLNEVWLMVDKTMRQSGEGHWSAKRSSARWAR